MIEGSSQAIRSCRSKGRLLPSIDCVGTPDEGIAFYVVDESIIDVNDEQALAIELMQVDGRRGLAKTGRLARSGDENDLYPSLNRRTIGRTTNPSLTLPNGAWTGITVRVRGNPGDDEMFIDVTMV